MTPSDFKPYPLFASRHAQTVLPLWLSPTVARTYHNEALELPDGDFVDLAWLRPPQATGDAPLLILFHGLEGSAQSAYARRMINAADALGWQAVVMHFRGCSHRMNRLPRTYHSGETQDALYLIETLQRRFPATPLLAVGYSLGGNMLLKLCGEQGAALPLRAAVSVCAPLRLDECANQMQRGLSRVYQRHLLSSLKRKVLRKFNEHDYRRLIGLGRDQVKRLNSFWAFDEAFTAPVHGFAGAADYYRRCSAYTYINRIQIPTLVLQARDDPFMTEAVIPAPEALADAVTLEVAEAGGHVGFIAGRGPRPVFWLEQRILRFLCERVPDRPDNGTQEH